MQRSAPSALRNRGPIAEVLARFVPAEGLLLEIASGTGEHAVYFAERFPHLRIQPTDPSLEARESIEAHRLEASCANLLAPLALDVEGEWPITRADLVLCINMIHIAPPEATPALMHGAARVLPAAGRLVTYGAIRIDGAHTAPSNVAFEAWLKGKDPRFGVRDLGWLMETAKTAGLELEARVAMPAENFTLVWRKTS